MLLQGQLLRVDLAAQLAHPNGTAERGNEVVPIDGLLDEIVRPAAQRLDRQVVFAVAGDQQGGGIGPQQLVEAALALSGTVEIEAGPDPAKPFDKIATLSESPPRICESFGCGGTMICLPEARTRGTALISTGGYESFAEAVRQ